MDIELSQVTAQSLGIHNLQITDSHALDLIDGAIAKVIGERSKYGAYENRLTSHYSFLDTQVINQTGAVSQIMDADMARESIAFVRSQMAQQASLVAVHSALDLYREYIKTLLTPPTQFPGVQQSLNRKEEALYSVTLKVEEVQ
ncbi:hypothetical protein E5161_14385 [Cohnella pontilimi]|uniref:Flagellin C-terminal domain-containing protein n=2 Tax=Cohnella pontilimi TaxID=2564100 RepID=A0A4V5LS30_9BACL|nr:hypothetical protein E5161_14385 [Cohnella pontilimi]